MKTILFDFDGVIADSLVFAFNWFHFAAEQFGVKLPFNDLEKFRTAFIEPYPEFYKWLGFDWTNDKNAIYRAYMTYHSENTLSLIDGIEDVLSELGRRPDIKLGIVSSNLQEILERSLDRHHIADQFDVVIGAGGDHSIPLKPDPTSLLMALSHLNAPLSDSVYIGDQPSDVLTAHNASLIAESGSMQTIAIATGFASRNELEKALPRPDHIVDNPWELLNVLEN